MNQEKNNYPKVFIIVLQYNHSEETFKCLDSLQQITYPDFKVIVVDNASDAKHANSTRLYIKQDFEGKRDFLFISNDNNLGYAGGNNTGIKYAMENNADYVLILNNDTTVDPDFLNAMVKIAESDKSIGIVQSVIAEEGDKVYAGGPISWLNPYGQHSTLEPGNHIIESGYYAIGASMLIKRELIEDIGPMDDIYFLYREDIEYNLRARSKGWTIAIAKRSLIFHEMSVSAGSLGNAKIMYYNYRNMLLLAEQYAPWYIKFLLPLWVFFTILKQQLKMFIGRNTEISRMIITALKDYKKRQFGQKIF
ncbi:MAG: glycosyltransferase family 2 protein [Parcubacteria group bacterium]